MKRHSTLADLTPDPNNARQHPDRNRQAILASIEDTGLARSIVIDEAGVVLAGNGVLDGAKQAGKTKLQIVEADGDTLIAVRRRGLTPEQKARLAIADNRTAELAVWDPAVLRGLADGGVLEGFFTTEELAAVLGGGSEPAAGGSASGSLATEFGVPPFSVLDARQGYWQDRKRAWISLGIQSELGRGGTWVESAETGGQADRQAQYKANASPGGSPRPAMKLKDGKTERGDGRGRKIPERINRNLNQSHPATSATIDFYAQKRALEKETGRKMTTPEARAILADRGTIVDSRQANKDAMASEKTSS